MPAAVLRQQAVHTLYRLQIALSLGSISEAQYRQQCQAIYEQFGRVL